jgi:uncharacterized membrane protein YgcG
MGPAWGLRMHGIASLRHDGPCRAAHAPRNPSPTWQPLLAATTTVSCSFALPAAAPPCPRLAARAAAAALQAAALTGGRRNFGFAAAVNCGTAGIPFFPVASSTPEISGSFGIGLEADGVLHAALARVAVAVGADKSDSCAAGRARRPVPLEAASAELTAALLAALQPIEALALRLEAAGGAGGSGGGGNSGSSGGGGGRDGSGSQGSSGRGFRYLGIDSSIAPGLDTPPLTASFELLGLGRFGGAGTLAACAAVTRALKALPLRLTGGWAGAWFVV